MKPLTYTYQDPSKQTTFYRGYTREYTGTPTVIIHNCKHVRGNRFDALADARKLIKKLKTKVIPRQ